jgi:glycosyltransferase involved in cell wall biosynthesis
LLDAADVYCQANTGPESFGIALVEALYAGLPVVTSALGGALEVIEEPWGVLVPPGHIGALAGALGGLLADGGARRRLAEGGPARAAALCDPARQLGRLGELLKELCVA